MKPIPSLPSSDVRFVRGERQQSRRGGIEWRATQLVIVIFVCPPLEAVLLFAAASSASPRARKSPSSAKPRSPLVPPRDPCKELLISAYIIRVKLVISWPADFKSNMPQQIKTSWMLWLNDCFSSRLARWMPLGPLALLDACEKEAAVNTGVEKKCVQKEKQ